MNLGKIQSQVEYVRETNNLTKDKNPFFVTYNVDLKQFQDYKNVVAEKFHVLKDIMDVNIKEVFFKPYTNKDIIVLINIQIKTMDLVRAINEYIRADASVYLEWRYPIRYDQFGSQMLSEYKQEEADKENIKNVEQLISDEIGDFSDNWFDNETLISSSKNSFYFRSRQLIDKIHRLLRGFASFIYNNILKLCFGKLRECYHRIRAYIRNHEWIRILIGYVVLSILSGLCQAIFQKWIVGQP